MSRKSGTGEGWWVHLKGANSVAVSGLSFTNTLVGTGWAVSLLVLSPCMAPISGSEASNHTYPSINQLAIVMALKVAVELWIKKKFSIIWYVCDVTKVVATQLPAKNKSNI